jgi:membrane-associated protein
MPDLKALVQLLIEFLRVYYASYGYWIVFLGALLENTFLLGLVMPGGTMVLLGAFYARLGDLQLPVVIGVGWAGMFLGTSLDYWAGRRGLQPLFWRVAVLRRFRKELARARVLMMKYGLLAIVVAHFIGHLRSFVALSSGASRLPYWRFALYELVASGLWNVLYCSLGYILAENLGLLEKIYSRVGWGLLALVILIAVIRYFWLRYRDRLFGITERRSEG